MSLEFVRVTHNEGVVQITLDRPPVNVLNIPMMRELRTALESIAGDETAAVVVLSGAGRAFCAGVDVADHTADRVEEMLAVFHGAIEQILQLPVPVVAAVNGAALGGGLELALACDLVLAAETAKLGQPEIRLAVFPPVAAVLMPRQVGRQHALDLILTGRTIAAAEGARIGLVNRVVSDDDFEDALDDLVDQFTRLSRPVVRMAKRVVDDTQSRSLQEALAHAESVYLNELMQLEDPHEGLAAFMEKRTPAWANR